MLLHHLADRHPTEAKPSLARMATEDIATVAAAYEVIEAFAWWIKIDHY
jgi:hypothetical protein